MPVYVRLPLAGLCLLLLIVGVPLVPAGRATAQPATPAAAVCAAAGTPAAAPTMMSPMMPGTPAAKADFDQTYIDMMLPHHASVIALAQVALPVLHDPQLRAIATDIISSQSSERQALRQFRSSWYGSPDPAPMDQVMAAMAVTMPDAYHLMMQDMDLMDSQAIVQRFCGSADLDVAFIDLVIPHHQSAILASQAAVTRATHPQLRAFADTVITAQRAQVDQMAAIRITLSAATPSP